MRAAFDLGLDLLRDLSPLCDRIKRDDPMLVSELLRMPVVLELLGLGQAQGTTLSTLFLQCTLLTRQKQTGQREVLQHITLIEESHRLLKNIPASVSAESANPRGKAVEEGDRPPGSWRAR